MFNMPIVQSKSKRPVKKHTMLKATYPGEIVHMDVSGPFPITLGCRRYWIMYKDRYSGMSWNNFVLSENRVYEITNEKVYNFLGLRKNLKLLRCDIAQEYGKIEQLCNRFGDTMEYTAPTLHNRMA
jgi:hypothetical protein